MKIKLRKATIKDFKIFQNFNRKLFYYDKKYDKALDLEWPDKKAGIDYYKKTLKDVNNIFLIAEDEDKKPIGLVACGITKKFRSRKVKIVELQNIFVLKKYRRMGIGSRFVDELLVWAKTKKADKFYVSSYFNDRKAIDFYKKNKFKPVDLALEIDI